MRHASWILVALIFAATPVFPSDQGWWKASLVMMAATQAADTAISLKLQSMPRDQVGTESGWLYGGRFDSRAVVIKCGLTAGLTAIETLIVRHHHGVERWFAVGNFGMVAGTMPAVVGNARKVPK